jgi:hypothetical protein
VALGATERPVWRLIGSTAGIFGAYPAGGLLLKLRPLGTHPYSDNRPGLIKSP